MLMWKKHLSQSKSPQKGTIYESAEEQIQVGNNMVIEVREEIEAQPSLRLWERRARGDEGDGINYKGSGTIN